MQAHFTAILCIGAPYMWSTAFVKASVYSYMHVYGALVMYERVLTQNISP